MEELGLEYRSMSQYLQKKSTKEQLIEELDRAIARYAKRQMRWFKRNKEIHWVKNKSEALSIVRVYGLMPTRRS
jgi:tRNA dimethylallyltransferase